jgi:hypothetical protein
MTLDFDCPYCSHPFTIDRAAAGSEILCPGCRVIMTLPHSLRMTKREVRRRLWPLAIGLSIAGLVHLLLCGVVAFLLATADNVPPDIELVAFYAMAVAGIFIASLPGVIMLLGARAMFRGQNFHLALAGNTAAAGMGLCCCLPLAGVGIWGNSFLNDPLLRDAMDRDLV